MSRLAAFLARVLEVASSDFGYRFLRELLLEDRPLPDLGDDWFRARDVRLFSSRARLDDGVKLLVGRVAEAEDYRSAVRAAWKLRRQVIAIGAKEPVRGTRGP